MHISEKWKACTNITGIKKSITWAPPWASQRHPSVSLELLVNVRCILLRLCSESSVRMQTFTYTSTLLAFVPSNLVVTVLFSSLPYSLLRCHLGPSGTQCRFIYYLGVSAEQGTPDGHLPPAFISWRWRMEGKLEKISFAKKKQRWRDGYRKRL